MKKILLLTGFMAIVGFVNQSSAQCSGATAVITNFTVVPQTTSIQFSFDWTYDHGNASIQVAFLCNGVEQVVLGCLPRLKDSTLGAHHVTGVQSITCTGVLRVEVRVYASPACGGTFCTVFRDVSQSTLPVVFKSFSAARSNGSVSIKWETASERNNTGFAVEKNSNGSWQQVAWVPSLALNGNSDADLSYFITDANNAKAMTQYRVRQVDLDGKAKYSDIRSVRGDGQIGKVIAFPNPSNDGKVNVSFEDGSTTRNITVIDINGRTVKEFHSYTNNSIVIDNLQPGLYTLKITVPQTGEQSVQKIVVNKR
jgi:hypothetical protein